MKKILIIDIDPKDRPSYSTMVARSFRKMDPEVSLSLISSTKPASDEGVLFENVLVIDPGKALPWKRFIIENSIDSLEESLQIYSSTSWDFIFNFSRHPMGALLTGHLSAKEFHGMYIEPGIWELRSSNLLGFLNFKFPGEIPFPLLEGQLYRNIVEMDSGNTPTKHARDDQEVEPIQKKFLELKQSSGRSGLTILDASMCDPKSKDNTDFIAGLYLSLFQKTKVLPIIVQQDSRKTVPIIEKIKKFAQLDVHVLTVKDEALSTVFSLAELVITDNNKFKRYADLALTRSVFIHSQGIMIYSRASSVPGSIQISSKTYDKGLIGRIANSVAISLGDTPLPFAELETKGFKTVELLGTKTLQPVDWHDQNKIPKNFVRWSLLERFCLGLSGYTLTHAFPGGEAALEMIMNEKIDLKDSFTKLMDSKRIAANVANISAESFPAYFEENPILGICLYKVCFQLGENDLSSSKFTMEMEKLIKEFDQFASSLARTFQSSL